MTDPCTVTQSTSMQMYSRKPFLARHAGDGQDLRMDGCRKMDGFKICGMHVDLHQDGADRVAVAHSRNVRVPEAKDVIHYALRELGL